MKRRKKSVHAFQAKETTYAEAHVCKQAFKYLIYREHNGSSEMEKEHSTARARE